MSFFSRKKSKARAYTAAHEASLKSGRQGLARYREKFEPMVAGYRDEALNWDTDQRREANVSRMTGSARLGVRRLRQAAGADVGDIIRSGVAEGSVMTGAAVAGDQITGQQKLNKLGTVAAFSRGQQGVVDQGMMNQGRIESQLNQQKAAIDEYLGNMEGQLAGQVVGLGAGMYAGGWWSGGGGVTGKQNFNSQDPARALNTNPKTGQSFNFNT